MISSIPLVALLIPLLSYILVVRSQNVSATQHWPLHDNGLNTVIQWYGTSFGVALSPQWRNINGRATKVCYLKIGIIIASWSMARDFLFLLARYGLSRTTYTATSN